MKSILSRVIALMVLLSMVVAPVSAQSTTPNGPKLPIVDRSTLSGVQRVDKSSLYGLEAVPEGAVINEVADSKQPARYIVVLPDQPLATYQGGIAGISATAPSITGKKLDVNSLVSQNYLAYLNGQQASYLIAARNALGFAPKVLFQYRYATNGFSMLLTSAEAEILATQTGAKVYRAPIETPDTDEGPALIGAPAIWDGDTASGVATKGEGILVGIIDTGINFDHPSFSAIPEDGYSYIWPGVYLGVCAPGGDPAYVAACNKKLVGAFTYVATDPDETISPEDSEGHGSHTASTVAGNVVDVEFQGVITAISGVAPHAQIISFDVCVPTPPNGACYGDATVMAVDDAIANDVDVINYSISGGESPYTDPVELAFLAATEAGIFVSTSAGNSGDTTGASSVAHRSPWVSTVAASTHARIFANAVDITGPGTVPGTLVGIGAYQSGSPIAADLVNLPIKYQTGNLDGCAAFPAGFFTGSFALIQRGTCSFAIKETNARNAGAQYVFIFNSRTGPPVGMSGVTSAAMLSMEDGLAIQVWIDSNPTATATMFAQTSRIVNPAWQDIVASFSSFGPNTTFDVLKPDITAPGVNILAAVSDGTIAPSLAYELDLYQGTSMSSPFNAGAAALVMALHPEWTPMQVRSAMMMTAQDSLLADRSAQKEGVRPATPEDEGSGRIALQNTALVGLVLDETIANFKAADPALSGNPASLNLASLYSSKCVGKCTWTRTVKSVLQTAADYTVSAPAWVTVVPSTFTIAAGGTQVLTITADVLAAKTDVWQYGKIVFETNATHPSTTTAVPNAHIPLAVLPTSSNIPALVKFDSHRDAAGATISDLQALEITAGNTFNAGLAKAQLETFALDPDPTNGDPIDDLSQVFVKRMDIPAYSIRVVAEITETTASDLDMFLYYDADGSGDLSTPDFDYLVAQSATGTALEYINAPKDWIYYNQPDTYFLLVQNWSGATGDTVTLATGIVPVAPPADNYQVLVPATNPAGQPFAMDILWNEDTEDGDRLYGYFETYADVLGDVFIGGTDIDIHRLADDVVKTADVAEALPGDVITYTIEVTNFSADDVTYDINDVLPAGVTYVPGSVTGGATYDAGSNAILWNGPVIGSHQNYVMSTSTANSACAMPLANSGAYVDLKLYGILAQAITGEGTWGFTVPGDSINFYGQNAGNVIRFTDDGYAYLDVFSAKPATNADIPTAAAPNNLIAMLWRDMNFVYDAATNKGVSLANLTTGGIPSGHLIEFDDIHVKDQPTQSYDMEMFISKAVDPTPGEFEVVVAYDNIAGPLDIGTVGLENASGTEGVKFAYNDAALTKLTNGMAICFNWQYVPSEPVVITFQVTVDMDADFGPLTNEALHDNNALGTLEESAKAVVGITMVPVAVADAYTTAEDTVLIVAAPGVLANDSDANGAALTAELVTDVTNGTLVLASDGSFNYTPDLDFFGEDSFTYKAFNGTYRSPAATVTITVTPVNDAPMAVDDAYSVVENTLLTVAAPGVLANDVEVDPDNMVVTLVSNVAHGSLVLLGDGSFTYQPAPDFFGTDTFVYRLITYPAIQSMWTDEATVTITVTEEIPVVFYIYLPMIIK
jgi:uncharacterized repeat protein (TIGR01451 family)